jgi:hypothetical protein
MLGWVRGWVLRRRSVWAPRPPPRCRGTSPWAAALKRKGEARSKAAHHPEEGVGSGPADRQPDPSAALRGRRPSHRLPNPAEDDDKEAGVGPAPGDSAPAPGAGLDRHWLPPHHLPERPRLPGPPPENGRRPRREPQHRPRRHRLRRQLPDEHADAGGDRHAGLVGEAPPRSPRDAGGGPPRLRRHSLPRRQPLSDHEEALTSPSPPLVTDSGSSFRAWRRFSSKAAI